MSSANSACQFLLHLLLLVIPPSAPATVTLDAGASAPSALFDGVGAISGGGGETVLLPSYPAAERSEILDFLFKPNFGASLHILKIEVGGDALSTDGAEPSHMHTEAEAETGSGNFHRGYEWWVAKQARRRNPRVKLYALPWEWPAWVGEGTGDPYHNMSKPLRYVISWLRGAKEVHGLAFDYMGVWNENRCEPDYVVALRNALDEEGFELTKIIAPDAARKAAGTLISIMLERPDVRAAVHAVGYHYPNSNPNVSVADQILLGRSLWASEDDSTVDPPFPPSGSAPVTPHPRRQPGGACLVRTINQNWVQGNMTATIVWNLVMARYPQMRWDYTGLVAATDPFGGHYDVLPPVWAAAHTTQFTQPGWRLLGVGHGSGWLQAGGSYVSYVSPSGEDVTIVVEKMDANESMCERGGRPEDRIAVTSAENVTFDLRDVILGGKIPGGGGGGRGGVVVGGISEVLAGNLTLWASHFGGEEPGDDLFLRMADVTIVDGKVTIEAKPNWAYTLSSVRTASKGGKDSIVGDGRVAAKRTAPTAANAVGKFPFIYSDDFDHCALYSIPKYVAPMAGAFECVAANDNVNVSSEILHGVVLRQMSPTKAICDRGDVTPYAVLGDGFRTEYNVSIDVLLTNEGGGGAFVGARTKGPVGSGVGMDGVFFAVNATRWRMSLNISGVMGPGTIASGVFPPSLGSFPPSNSKWRRLSLAVSGTSATASVDGVVVARKVEVPAPRDHRTAMVAGFQVDLGKGGYASFGTVGYGDVRFDNLRVESSQ